MEEESKNNGLDFLKDMAGGFLIAYFAAAPSYYQILVNRLDWRLGIVILLIIGLMYGLLHFLIPYFCKADCYVLNKKIDEVNEDRLFLHNVLDSASDIEKEYFKQRNIYDKKYAKIKDDENKEKSLQFEKVCYILNQLENILAVIEEGQAIMNDLNAELNTNIQIIKDRYSIYGITIKLDDTLKDE